ncbi:N-acetyl-gamma-glutamyl-phosphate reductase [Sulfobacillus thermosulfidooxidans]|uniref:N-acetyl-gamma-glutamyl-phosphate reductase n=1 Tax=Sulfobacillus thermosulfidooxidans TaxID=28034 RepID=UPI0006B45C1B|nr:N-acetyl-gamma-glutamyl-phosphate reductase [Sulfobacillus thermosulfidooxidans]
MYNHSRGDTMRAVVVGATGYAGQEVVKILARHPEFEIVALTSSRQQHEPVSLFFPYLFRGPSEFIDPKELSDMEFDWVFSCQGPKQATPHFFEWIERGARIVDLSADFRFQDINVYERAYGSHPAPELLALSKGGYADDPYMHYDDGMRILGNPGCYPTAFNAAIAPLIAAGQSLPLVIVDGKSGVSGAGRTPREHLMMAEMVENVTPYNDPGKHRHTFEMEAVTGQRVVFQPHLMPMARGMELTIYIPNSSLSANRVVELWQDYYDGNRFITVLSPGQKPETRRVRDTNRVELGVSADERSKTLVLYSALDNLQKGAAGQAVQHVNRWMNWPMELGLE